MEQRQNKGMVEKYFFSSYYWNKGKTKAWWKNTFSFLIIGTKAKQRQGGKILLLLEQRQNKGMVAKLKIFDLNGNRYFV